jgi:glycine cleavage system transcriptional repressor
MPSLILAFDRAAEPYSPPVRTYALSAVGADRPGIIAAVAERLVAHGVNVTDSQMGILRGFFAMQLVITAADELDDDALEADLAAVAADLRLDAMTLRAVVDHPHGALEEPTHTVSVYGADHPGILAAVTGTLAAAGVNVCDMRTRLVGEETEAPVYVMVIAVSKPAATDEAALSAGLQAVGERQGVDITLQASDADVL